MTSLNERIARRLHALVDEYYPVFLPLFVASSAREQARVRAHNREVGRLTDPERCAERDPFDWAVRDVVLEEVRAVRDQLVKLTVDDYLGSDPWEEQEECSRALYGLDHSFDDYIDLEVVELAREMAYYHELLHRSTRFGEHPILELVKQDVQ